MYLYDESPAMKLHYFLLIGGLFSLLTGRSEQFDYYSPHACVRLKVSSLLSSPLSEKRAVRSRNFLLPPPPPSNLPVVCTVRLSIWSACWLHPHLICRLSSLLSDLPGVRPLSDLPPVHLSIWSACCTCIHLICLLITLHIICLLSTPLSDLPGVQPWNTASPHGRCLTHFSHVLSSPLPPWRPPSIHSCCPTHFSCL